MGFNIPKTVWLKVYPPKVRNLALNTLCQDVKKGGNFMIHSILNK